MRENMVKIQFPDGKAKEFSAGTTVAEIASYISPSLRKKAVAGKVNDQTVDLSYELNSDAVLSILTLDSEEGLEVLRHTSAHVLAQAVKRLYDDVTLGIGPVVENGFYYDMKLNRTLRLEDLAAIEKEMENIMNENHLIQRIEVSYKEAEALFANDPYKLDILKGLPKQETITVYQQGEFIDLCRGPHLPSTGYMKACKLTRVAGAYWRGDRNHDVLQRVYGVAFQHSKHLADYLRFIEEANKRDHRKLGKQLSLFMFSEEAPGMPFYLPKGQIVRNELMAFSREVRGKAQYEEVSTPFMMNQELWEQSGHWDHYHENMYFSEVDHTSFALKPMNCPGHMLMFKNNLYSYRDLPIRMAEFGQVHRHEYSGALNGLFRVRTFCQDDAHIFLREDQIESEIKQIFQLVDHIYRTFGFEYSVELSTRPEKALGDDAIWHLSETSLKNVLDQLKVDYQLNEGDGAFYGPKIDFHIKDALERSHQCATIQLDFQMPEKFDLTYINEKNEKVRPVVIHSAIFGSLDRFLGILIEHFAGAFPLWLAPVQVQIIPVSSVHLNHCLEVQQYLKSVGIRVTIDERDEKLGYKMREAQMQKMPYIAVIGDKEMQEKTLNIRRHGEKASEQMSMEDFKGSIAQQIKQKKIAQELV
ncbi:threonine--tRNA ligase [Bacillus pumilus]|uniref:Threonine--tRNA ligase n=1 Tax=Bacillus pumilus TaxID=1408 RepID=A0A2A5IZ05_BACPU|nr:threonine--tRNA ligase [Bacillus pumilus]PCK22565.1 threonine--tRNA ligase [Bacillus pumilus]